MKFSHRGSLKLQLHTFFILFTAFMRQALINEWSVQVLDEDYDEECNAGENSDYSGEWQHEASKLNKERQQELQTNIFWCQLMLWFWFFFFFTPKPKAVYSSLFVKRKSTFFVKRCIVDNFKSFGKIPLYQTSNLPVKEADEQYAIIKETYVSFKIRKSV